MDDLMGVFGNGTPGASTNGNASNDLMNGFASLDMNGGQPPPPQQQLGNGGGGGQNKGEEDLLGMF